MRGHRTRILGIKGHILQAKLSHWIVWLSTYDLDVAPLLTDSSGRETISGTCQSCGLVPASTRVLDCHQHARGEEGQPVRVRNS